MQNNKAKKYPLNFSLYITLHMFEKQIKINCSWIPSEGKSTTNGHAWRLWTINLEASKVDLSEYIDHVEYILHESFGSPPIGR